MSTLAVQAAVAKAAPKKPKRKPEFTRPATADSINALLRWEISERKRVDQGVEARAEPPHAACQGT